MKTFSALFFVLFIINSAMSQWEQQNSGTSQSLRSVCFTDINTGYAVGDSGTILRTTNGGTTWEILNPGISDNLYSVHFPKPDTGYAVGGDGNLPSSVILKTTDGGTTWDTLTSGIPYPIHNVYFTDAGTGYAIGSIFNSNDYISVVLKTTDGGVTWSIIFTATNWRYGFSSIYFPGPDIGYISGGVTGWEFTSSSIYKTTDGGTNWSYQEYNGQASSNDALNSLFFINNNTGYAVGYERPWDSYGLIIKTTNGGEQWESCLMASNIYSLNSVFFTDISTGFVVGESITGEGVILKTTDAGTSWGQQASGVIHPLNWVHFPGADTGYAVGDSGTILRTTNGGGYYVDLNDFIHPSKTLTIYPNPAIDQVNIETRLKDDLTLLNHAGQEIIKMTCSEPETQIDISYLPCGIYIVRVINDRGVQVGKVVKE
jgi:photosystem II stability/assembly factor-like uncharacterized protein